MKNLIYLFLLVPIIFSCQNYNSPPYDKSEEALRKLPIESTKRMVLDSLWPKRDSLSYLRLTNLDLIMMTETSSIPNWIGSLKKMRIFKVVNDNKKVMTIPKSFGDLSNLVEVSIANNQVSSLPSSFYNLTNLNYLDLKKNPLKELDINISNFQNLRILLLSNTDLKKLPNNICQLQNLESLDLENSEILELPKCIGNMGKLNRINISNTQITELPVEILNALKLETIDAKGLELKNYKEVKTICEKKNINFYYD